MTTKVTVDAHAGWPVLVRSLTPGTGAATTGYPDATVPPNETRDFYVHSTLDLLVHEVQPTENAPSFQQRVIAEQVALSGNVNRLAAFIDSPVFADLPKGERGRLVVQLRFMQGYETVLLQRIEAFSAIVK